jgi:hypothetical protein
MRYGGMLAHSIAHTSIPSCLHTSSVIHILLNIFVTIFYIKDYFCAKTRKSAS